MRQGDGPGPIVREAHAHPPVPMSDFRQKSPTNSAELKVVIQDFDSCYRAVKSRDTRFDRWFFTGVTSTHIYCRPSCPAITPKRSNVRFYPTAASAQQAGFPACMRCRPGAAPGVEAYVDGTFLRSLDLPHGEGIVELTPDVGCVRSTFYLQDLRDLTAAVTRCRRLLDLDADPMAIDETLSLDPLLSSSVRHTPGKRMPGAVDGAELAVRAVIGQQVSVAGARTVTGRLVAVAGRPLVNPRSPLTHLFPTADEIAAAGDPAFA